jgi:membrane-associated phospholipid phosphatase
MFQTEPILFLQTFASDGLTALMAGITWFGYAPAYAAILGAILFGVHFQKGFSLLQIVLWTAILNDSAKEFFALPRPFHVDSHVRLLGQSGGNTTNLESMGASGFWSRLDTEIVDRVRSRPATAWGFPSGHAAVFSSLWGGLAFLFESVLVRIMVFPMILAMAISRMYLGRHFLADVAGGVALGGAVVLLGWSFLRHNQGDLLLSKRQPGSPFQSFPRTLSRVYLILLPLLGMFLLPADGPRLSGLLLGVNLGFLATPERSRSHVYGSLWSRLMRVFLAGTIFFGTAWLIDGLSSSSPVFLLPGAQALMAMSSGFLFIWGTVTAAAKVESIVGRRSEFSRR